MAQGSGASVPVGKVFDALADPTRRAVVETLTTGPRRAGELAAAAGTTPPTMSRHLRVLLDAGIVADERPPDDARTRVFRLRPESMTALQAWLDQIQAHWDEQLHAFRRHVDERNQHDKRNQRNQRDKRDERNAR